MTNPTPNPMRIPLKMKPIVMLVAGLLIGGFATFWFLSPTTSVSNADGDSGEKQPLYWVAPMDPNYRRDKPGKSPMGMDLVPVYEEENTAKSPGTVNIDPTVVNNLGVRIATVQKQPWKNTFSTVGYVQYDEDRLIHIHPRVSGWIDTLFVKTSGDPVKKGQPLYELYSPELVNAQEEYLLALQRNNSSFIRASEERLKALQLPESLITRLKQQKKVSQRITFFAPQNGVVDNLNIREGFFVQPGTTLMSIGDLSQVWVEAEIFERQVSSIDKNASVSMSLGYYPGDVWQGKIDYVYPTLNPETRTVKIRLRFDNNDARLKPHMFAQLQIVSQQQETLTVPREAVIRTGVMDRVVLALPDNQFKSVKVQVGRVDDQQVEILSGLQDGDRVVTSAQFLLDSESSIASDFLRQSPREEAKPTSVWTSATIHRVDRKVRTVNATHEAINEWGWPEMTMNFDVARSVPIDDLTEGLSLHIEITKSESKASGSESYAISNIHIMDAGGSHRNDVQSARVQGTVKAIRRDTREVTIERGPIEKWNRPAARVDFVVDESIDMSLLRVNETIDFTFEVTDDFVIVMLHQSEKESNQPSHDHSSHRQP